MAILPSLIDFILAEETDVESPVSEQLVQKLGSNINALIAPTYTINQITASGSYTKPSNLRYAVVICVGGGGGSGGVSAAGDNSGSGGGAGGGAAIKFLKAADIGVSETVTIGAGGTAGTSAPTAGGSGGTTSFGSLCAATGGGGSPSCTAGPFGSKRTEGSNSFGAGTIGDILLRGTCGLHNVALAAGGNSPLGFGSGRSLLGAFDDTTTGTGGDSLDFHPAQSALVGLGFGAGASGATVDSGSATGAAGTAGVIVVIEIT